MSPISRLDAVRQTAICILLLAATCAFSQSTPANGKICGSVIDENGNPASNVKVAALLMDPGGHTGGYPWTLTDESGHYCIDRLTLGRYRLSGDDKGLGYPMWGNSLYTWRSSGPEVDLTPQKPHADLDWKLPFRAGFLYLKLPPARSSDEIAPITIKLVAVSRPRFGMMSVTTFPETRKSKEITVLLPPQEDVFLIVSVPSDRNCPGDGSRGKLLNVLPGAIEHVSVGSLGCYSAILGKSAPMAQPQSTRLVPPPVNDLPGQIRVVPPRLIDSVVAKYSPEALEARYEGICLLQLVVDADGRATDVHVMRALGINLDENAIKAVMQYRFKPGTIDGRPTPMRISIAVPFRLPK